MIERSVAPDILICAVVPIERHRKSAKNMSSVLPPVFLSYNHDHQAQVKALKIDLENAGYRCWMDIDQMGGGDRTFAKIDEGIRAAKVVICCVTTKYAESESCTKEVCHAESLHKNLIPLKLEEKVEWPLPGAMGLIFSQYLYIRFYKKPGEETNDKRCWPEERFHELLGKLRAHIDPDVDDFPIPSRKAHKKVAKSKKTYDDDGLPLPCPAVRTKKEVFNISLFKELDDKACKASATLLNKPLEQLVQYLVTGTKTELERVRVIFRWITAQNLAKLDGQNYNQTPSSALEYLIGIKAKTTSYNMLMADMCRHANIVTKEISGYTKHSEYEIGAPVLAAEESSWTAILIDQTWYLVDVHWSSKHVTGVNGEWQLLDDNGQISKDTKKDTAIEEHYQYDENYFLTNPEELIYSHFPQDSRWQLLERKISIEEFQQMAYLKLPFFQFGLRLISHKQCVIEAPDGLVFVQLGYKESRDFMYRLWVSSKGGQQTMSEKFNDVALRRFVFMENPGGMMTCKMRFPIAGKFKLELYCKTDSTNTYLGVCSYVINAARPAKNAKPFPENVQSEWGPGQALKKKGMRPLTHPEGFIESETGETVIKFKTDNPVEILVDLHSDTKTTEQLSGFVLHYIEKDEVVIKIKMPEKDDYVLNVYAEQDGKDKQADSKLPLVCSYVISSLEPAADSTPFPKITNGQLGPAKTNSSFEIQPVSYPVPLLTSPDNGSQMDFSFQVSKFCQLLAELKYCQDGSEKEIEGYTMASGTSSGTSTVSARFSQIGTYILNIYAKNTKKSNGDMYAIAYTYMIEVHRPTDPCFLFPKKYSAWTPACQLAEPDINRPLFAHSTIPFRVDIPNAVDVAVVRADEWTHLDKRGRFWTGEVETGNVGDVLTLYANNSEGSRSFICMMELQVIAPIEIQDEDKCDSKIAPVQPNPPTPIEPQRIVPVQPKPPTPVQPQRLAPVQPKQPTPIEPQRTVPVQPKPPTPVQPQRIAPVQPKQPTPIEPNRTVPVEPKPPTPVQQETNADKINVNSTKETNIELRAEKKSETFKSKWRKTSPVRKSRVTTEPQPVDEDIDRTNHTNQWKEEFLQQEDRKLMGEKLFRIKRVEERAPKLKKLSDCVMLMRKSSIKT